eukprot:scaffold54858_cov51-Phaeocystis_antarctica.AAC.3
MRVRVRLELAHRMASLRRLDGPAKGVAPPDSAVFGERPCCEVVSDPPTCIGTKGAGCWVRRVRWVLGAAAAGRGSAPRSSRSLCRDPTPLAAVTSSRHCTAQGEAPR